MPSGAPGSHRDLGRPDVQREDGDQRERVEREIRAERPAGRDGATVAFSDPLRRVTSKPP
jgi:hypothetical protein